MNDEYLRLNKFISETGYCSRRGADKLIAAGKVTVNGKIAVVGVRVSANDKVQIEGRLIATKPSRVYLAYYKPVGVICTTERHVKGNILDAVGYHERIFPIGRLDKPSEGLILLTNHGDIVNKILRAGNRHEKEYVVTVNKPITAEFVTKMANGIPILGKITQKCRIRKHSRHVFKIILTQGLNRQIRRMCEYLGYEVVKLKRIRIMNISLQGLVAGEWRALSDQQINQIQQITACSDKTESASISIKGPNEEIE